MLRLKGKSGSEFWVGPATITVVSLKSGSVELGFTAPWWMPVLRAKLGRNYVYQIREALTRLWALIWHRRWVIGPPRPGS